MRGDDDLDKSPEKSQSQEWQGFKFFCKDSGEELYEISNFSESNDIIPLSQARAGDIVLIVKLINIGCVKDLRNMGFLPQKEIQVISRTTTETVVVVLENQRIGLGKDMAKSILVRKVIKVEVQ
ncbi:MAG: ferrous iron transport protein A [Rivularia sp. (in: cyanobacteria)]